MTDKTNAKKELKLICTGKSGKEDYKPPWRRRLVGTGEYNTVSGKCMVRSVMEGTDD